METVDILYAVAELRSDYCPRLEFKVTLGKQVTCITVLHLTDAVFHVRYQGIILRLRFLYLLFQCHDFEYSSFHLAVVGRYRLWHIADAAAIHTLSSLTQQTDFM